MRRFGYGLIGLMLGVIVFLLMITQIPEIAEVRSTVGEFVGNITVPEEGDYEEYISDDFLGGSITPFLEYGSYHVTPADFKDYQQRGIVKYGKINPMFYYQEIKQTITDENDEEDILDFDDNSLSKPSGSTGLPVYHTGFNLDSRKEEKVDVSHILAAFERNGKLPVGEEYYNLTSEYGKRTDPFTGQSAYHTGIDISGPGIDKSEVYAAIDGEVVFVKSDPEGYGYHIVLKHKGFKTLYAHMDSIPTLGPGDNVKAGDVLGYVGNTGRSTGPHLHFEVLTGQTRLDPESFVKVMRKVA